MKILEFLFSLSEYIKIQSKLIDLFELTGSDSAAINEKIRAFSVDLDLTGN